MRWVTHLDEPTMRRLVAVGQALVAHSDLEGVLEELLEIATDVTGTRSAGIGVLGEDRVGVARFVTRGAGEHPQSYGLPGGHPATGGFLGLPILIRGEAWGNLFVAGKADDGEFTAGDEEAIVALAGWAAIAIDNARLNEDAQGRRLDLERAVLRLEATTAIARAVGTETDLDRVLDLIGKRARALVGARSLLLLLADGEELVVAASAGQVDSRALGARIPRATSTLGAVLADRQAERIADLPSRFGLDDESVGVVGAETALLVPLVFRGTSIGVLAAFDRMEGDPNFLDDDEALLEGFAAAAATAVATAQSVGRERLRDSLRSAEAERKRWARALHDETLQALGAMRLILGSGLRSEDPQAAVEASREAAAQLTSEIKSLRHLITELRPAALDELGLGPAVESLVRRAAATDGLEAELRLQLRGPRMPIDLETAVYRVVQDALANAVKHARARHVVTRIERIGTTLEVEITDDGQGFDLDRPVEGFGLLGMRERAALANGRLEVISSAAGTSVRATFPVPEGDQSPTSPRSSA